MGGTPPHTMRIIDDDLEDLRAYVCEVGGRVEAAIADALEAIVTGDEERATQVVRDCRRLVEMDVEVDRKATRLIALRHPMADDLRVVVLAIKIAAILGRMTGGARNIALRVAEVRGCRGSEELKMLSTMGALVVEMVRVSLNSFARGDANQAAVLARQDRAVDGYYECVLKGLIDVMRDDPRQISAATHLLFVAKTLERIGDKAAKIGRSLDFAEDARGPREPQAA
jgi:phosphate transport system protein